MGNRIVRVLALVPVLFGGIITLPVHVFAEPKAQGSYGYIERGRASWYGPPHHGRLTASSERFNKNALTAAHRWLPFNTYIRVTHLRTKRSVDVRINDRGPFKTNRIIDLSEQPRL